MMMDSGTLWCLSFGDLCIDSAIIRQNHHQTLEVIQRLVGFEETECIVFMVEKEMVCIGIVCALTSIFVV